MPSMTATVSDYNAAPMETLFSVLHTYSRDGGAPFLQGVPIVCQRNDSLFSKDEYSTETLAMQCLNQRKTLYWQNEGGEVMVFVWLS